MIKESLLNWKFYENRLPLLFKQTKGLSSHFKILFDLLVILDELYEEFFDLLKINEKTGSDYDSYPFVLDMLANFLGINRENHIKYTNRDGELIEKDITLSNKALLIYIKTTIKALTFDGSREQFNDSFNQLAVSMIPLNVSPAVCDIYAWNFDDEQLVDMFLSGLISYELLGITIRLLDTNLDFAKYDDSEYAYDAENTRWGY